jgi:hypothetical protein
MRFRVKVESGVTVFGGELEFEYGFGIIIIIQVVGLVIASFKHGLEVWTWCD